MRIFVTGASGFIGSAVVPELVSAGHHVIGLARSDGSAAAVKKAGAEVLRGDLDDVDTLRAGAAKSDGVVHLAYIHDFSRMEAAAAADRRAIETIGSVLEGSGKPLAIASGMVGLSPGRRVTERDEPSTKPPVHPRLASTLLAQSFVARGVRTSVVRLAPTVHGPGDHGFVARLVAIAREHGVSGYIGDGSNCWPAVHVRDAASLFRLAIEKAPAGAVLHGVGDEGVPIRAIAEVIGRHLKLPIVSVASEDAPKHFGWLAMFLAMNTSASNAITREIVGWQPTHAGLLEDLEAGHYTDGR
jgi:nucleoside-diphosphate-sugar epimerase